MTWFNLGDRDLATHCYRTQRLARGGPPQPGHRRAGPLVRGGRPPAARHRRPRSAPGCVLADGPEIGFQEYFVRLRHDVAVAGSASRAPSAARPGPGRARGPGRGRDHRGLPVQPGGLHRPAAGGARRGRPRAADGAIGWSASRRSSPGPRSRARPTGCSGELGHESSVVGVARWYAPWVGTLVIDEADAGLADAVEAEGVRCVVAPTVMSSVGPGRRPGPGGPRCRSPEPGPAPAPPTGAGGLAIYPGHRAGRGARPATTWPTCWPGRPHPRRPAGAWPTATSWSSPRRSSPRPRAAGGRRPRRPRGQGTGWSRPSRCGSCAAAATCSSPRPATGSSAPTPASTCPTWPTGTAALLPRRPRPLGPPHPRRPPAPARGLGRGGRLGHLRPALAQRGDRRGHRRAPAWPAVVDLRGTTDASGRELEVTEVCVADELAGAAELVMGKDRGDTRRRRPRRRPRPGSGRPRWPPRSSGPRPRTCSADRADRSSGRPAALAADELEHGRRPLAEGRPRAPAELDGGPARVEAAPQQLPGRRGWARPAAGDPGLAGHRRRTAG